MVCRQRIRHGWLRGKVSEVAYMWPRPGADSTPVSKVTFVTKVADQVCGVGYYK